MSEVKLKRYSFDHDGAILCMEYYDCDDIDPLLAAKDAEIERLRGERLALAMLAAEKPMFDNPLTVYAAKEVRDRVLKEAIPTAVKT